MYKILLSFTCVFVIFGCQKKNGQNSTTKVSNGLAVKGGQFLSVAEIRSTSSEGYTYTCSGVWVAKNVLLTAATCQSPELADPKLKSEIKELYVDTRFDLAKFETRKYNYQIIVFKNDLAPDIMPISNRGFEDGDLTSIVGYGTTNYELKLLENADSNKDDEESKEQADDEKTKKESEDDVAEEKEDASSNKDEDKYSILLANSGQKRYGNIESIIVPDDSGIYITEGAKASQKSIGSGNAVNAMPGDEGGPLFIEKNDKAYMIGLIINSSVDTSSIDALQKRLFTNYIDLNQSTFKKFMSDIKAKTKYAFDINYATPAAQEDQADDVEDKEEEKENETNPGSSSENEQTPRPGTDLMKGSDLVRVLPTLAGSGEFKIKAQLERNANNQEYVDLSFAIKADKNVKEIRLCAASLQDCAKMIGNFNDLTTSTPSDKVQIGAMNIFNTKLDEKSVSKLSVFFTNGNQLIDHGYLEISRK